MSTFCLSLCANARSPQHRTILALGLKAGDLLAAVQLFSAFETRRLTNLFLFVRRHGTSLAERVDRDAAFGRILLFVAAAALAIAYVAIFFPYIPTADGDYRWMFAEWKVAGNTGCYPQLFVVAKGVTVLQTLTLWLFGRTFPFTLVQCFLAFLAVYGCIALAAQDRMKRSTRLLLWLVICNVPTFGVFFAVTTDSVWTFIGIVALAVVLLRPLSCNRVLTFVLAVLAALCLFASRVNALALVPVLIAAPFLAGWRAPAPGAITGTLIGLVAALVLPGQIVTTRPANPLALGMGWEILQVAKATKDRRIALELRYAGDPAHAIAIVKPEALNNVFWDRSPPLSVARIVAPENKSRMNALFLNMVKTQPLAYARNKAGMWLRILGITAPLMPAGYGFDIGRTVTRPTEGKVTMLNKAMFAALWVIGSSLPLLGSRPWILLLGGLLFVARQRRKGHHRQAGLIVLLALGYYCSFLVSAQAMEFRYFAPSYLVLFCVLLVEWILWLRSGRTPWRKVAPSL